MIKTILKTTSIALLIATTTFTSCQSNTPKTEAADQKVQDAKKELDDAKMKADAAQKTANDAEWTAFKADIEVKIQNNESEITALKAKMKSSKKKMDAAYVKSVDELEMKNKALKEKMNAYGNDTKADWESFKREFNHDMDELGSALKDLTVNNKK